MDDKQAITAVIQTYFDSLYIGDAEGFGRAFNPAARLFTVSGDTVATVDYAPYLERVAGRAKPSERGDAREDEIVSLEIVAPTLAVAVVRDCYLPGHYINVLTFLKTAGTWTIVSKVYHAL